MKSFPHLICACLLAAFSLLPPNSCSADDLTVTPASLTLRDAFDGRQLLVEQSGLDATRRATYSVGDPGVAEVDAAGFVTAISDGATVVVVELDDARREVAVTVAGVASGRAVDFSTDIVPLLNRYGCNSGGCHGKASGQNGFKLSLFGFDQAFDYDALVKQARGRRVFPAAPDHSLLLRKATGASPHGGGARFDRGSEAYRLLHRWIEIGSPPPSSEARQIVALHVRPSHRLLARNGTQQLALEAEYSDGSRRDVTRQAVYATNLDVVATANDSGVVQATGQSGEAAIMCRYLGQVAVFRAIVPHGQPLAELPGFKPRNYVDDLAAAKWRMLGLVPSPPCDDATFLRRVTIDLCGRVPTVDEAREFLDATDPDKRIRLIERLLDSPDYPAYFAMQWGTILRNSRLAGADQAAYAFHNWLQDLVARNRPYDELVRGVVAAAGEWQDAPAINWYWQMRDDQLHQVTADTAQVFLGVRLQCARCHHHPYERWGQEDYYGLAGFFTRLGRKSFGQPPPYFASPNVTTGERNPLTDKVPEPKYLAGEYATFSPEEDPRHALVDWMTRPDNPFFARVLVNRLWGHFLGRGLVHEVDDLRESNPPSNPELLDALARDFVEHKFDIKHMIRIIVSSQVYQLSSEPTDANQDDRQNFARFYARRMIAEVFHDAVDQACGTRTQFSGVSNAARAVDLPHEGFGSYFLDTFDRPRRVTGCECERSSGATLAQVLLLANSDDIENKLAHGDGRAAALSGGDRTSQQIVEECYLATFARRPNSAESTAVVDYLESQNDKRKALEDVLWSLINTREFAFNH